jgi:hypothetical protein
MSLYCAVRYGAVVFCAVMLVVVDVVSLRIVASLGLDINILK